MPKIRGTKGGAPVAPSPERDYLLAAVVANARAWLAAGKELTMPPTVNPDAWAGMSDRMKLFVIMHERMHDLHGSK